MCLSVLCVERVERPVCAIIVQVDSMKKFPLEERDCYLLDSYFKSIQGKDFCGLDTEIIKLLYELGYDYDINRYVERYYHARKIYLYFHD